MAQLENCWRGSGAKMMVIWLFLVGIWCGPGFIDRFRCWWLETTHTKMINFQAQVKVPMPLPSSPQSPRFSYMSLHSVLWACMQFHEIACMSLYAVPFFVWAAHKNFAVLVHKSRFKRFINPDLSPLNTQCQRCNNTSGRSRVYYKQITVTVFQTLTKIQFWFWNMKIFS